MTSPNTCFAYIRVSGNGQLSGDGFPRQREAIRNYAAAHKLQIVHWYEEEGVTGKAEWEDRPAWTEMVTAMNGTRTIVIERLDRLARDLMVQEHIIADLKARGITLISVYEPDLNSDDPTRVLMRQIMGAIAQYDRTMIVLKLQAARARVRAKTGHCEGRKPYGHYDGELENLAELKRLSGEGMSDAKVAREMNAAGRRTRGGTLWHPFTVGRILKRAK